MESFATSKDDLCTNVCSLSAVRPVYEGYAYVGLYWIAERNIMDVAIAASWSCAASSETKLGHASLGMAANGLRHCESVRRNIC